MPTTARIAPRRVKSNTEKLGMPCWIAMLLVSRFDDVPSSVHTPPICAAYDIGSSTRAGDVRVRAQTLSVTGRNVATSAVFLMNAPSTQVVSMIDNVSNHGRSMRDSPRINGSSAPVPTSPPFSANIAATTTVASLLNPDSPSAGVRIPSTISTTSTSTPTTSKRSFSLTNSAIEPITMRATAHACHVMR